jgi:hypothetical protein
MLLLYPWMWVTELAIGVTLVAALMVWDVRVPFRTA